MVQIYKIDLCLPASDFQNGFQLIQTIDLPHYRNILGIETTRMMIALSGSGEEVEVLNWEQNFDPSSKNHGKTVIKSYPEDLESLVCLLLSMA